MGDRGRLTHLFACLPSQPAYLKRRRALRETIGWLAGVFAAQSPGYHDDLVLLDSTPLECGRSLETLRRARLSECAGYGWSHSHSRLVWGMRLHLCCALDGTPGRAELRGADQTEREVALELLPRALRGGETVVCDKGYVGRGFERAVAGLGGRVVRARRQDEPEGSRPAPGAHPPAHRVGLSDLQGHPLARAPSQVPLRGGLFGAGQRSLQSWRVGADGPLGPVVVPSSGDSDSRLM